MVLIRRIRANIFTISYKSGVFGSTNILLLSVFLHFFMLFCHKEYTVKCISIGEICLKKKVVCKQFALSKCIALYVSYDEFFVVVSFRMIKFKKILLKRKLHPTGQYWCGRIQVGQLFSRCKKEIWVSEKNSNKNQCKSSEKKMNN